jgi:hypothetical protein
MHPRTYLKVGDKVIHLNNARWGIGEVIEERNSTLPEGLCLVRIIFEDGVERFFINNFDHEMCCYFTGIRIVNEFSLWET